MEIFRAPSEPSNEADLIRLGALLIDVAGFQVTINGRHVPLTLAEFLILLDLARHPHQVRDRQALAAALKQHGTPFDTAPASERSLDTHIARLRSKLREAGYNCIKTMRYVGYRLTPDGLSTTAESTQEQQDDP
ncbi:MAG TPA: winged helix-turn-helix domain-containing protein [Dehalococcoidia bacterium]|nr:winged helix-turn-helix domain-containing protein [Dehalococcoidia bacterium]